MRRHGMFPAPVPDQDRRPIRRQTVRRVIGAFRPYRGKVAWVGLAIVVTSGLGVVNPLLIKRIFDHALFGNPPSQCERFYRLGSLPAMRDHLAILSVNANYDVPWPKAMNHPGENFGRLNRDSSDYYSRNAKCDYLLHVESLS